MKDNITISREERQEELVSPFSLIIQDIYNIIQIFNQGHLRPKPFYLEQGTDVLLPALEEAQQFDSACAVAHTVMKVCEPYSPEAVHSPRPQPCVCVLLSSALAYNATAVSVFSEFCSTDFQIKFA